MNIVYTLYANLVMKESGKVFMWPHSIVKQKTCPKGKTIVNTTVSLLSINCTRNEVRSCTEILSKLVLHKISWNLRHDSEEILTLVRSKFRFSH